MVKEGELKTSRGWAYRELEFNVPSEGIKDKVEEKELQGEQLSMFEQKLKPH